MSEKIVVYQFSSYEKALIKERLSDLFSNIVFVEKSTDVQAMNVSEIKGVIISSSEENIEDVSSLYATFKEVPSIVFLRDKSYQSLLGAYRNKAIHLIEKELTPKDVEACLIKLQMFYDKLNRNIPQAEIIKLFESPLKVKKTEQLFNALRQYFSSFKEVKSFGIISFLGDEVQAFGDIDDNIDLTKLKQVSLPRHFIKHIETLKEGAVQVIASPVYEKNEKYQWLVIEIDKKQKDYILNDLFYKFLENVLIYKKAKDKEINLEKLAKTDDVTGLYNQRKLAEDLEMAINSHALEHDTFSIMFIDVDHFKDVNDNYGHIVGSNLLSELGNVLSLILRKSDHIYRYGGDEFVVIMPKIKISTVHEVATRVLEKIKDFDFKISDEEKYKMSVSVGIAEYPTDASSAVEIIKFADEMMYRSKKSGRGKVFHLKEVEPC